MNQSQNWLKQIHNHSTLTLAFIYLIIASVFQVFWLYNIKAIDKNKLAAIRFNNFYHKKQLLAVLPVVGYVLFGLCNVIFFTLSMDKINPSTAYAVWTGIVLSIASLVDKFYFGQKIKFMQYVFLLMIATGVIGLKFTTLN